MSIVTIELFTPTIKSKNLKYYKERLVDSIEICVKELTFRVFFSIRVIFKFVSKPFHANESISENKYE